MLLRNGSLSMPKIQPIEKSEVRSNREAKLHLLVKTSKFPSKDYSSELMACLERSRHSILVASTSTDELDQQIYQLLMRKINDRVRVYGLLHSFSNSSGILKYFDAKKPALFRENKELNNNFIIIDRETAFVFSNPVGSIVNNPCIKLDGEACADLFYWFTWYFWNTQGNERILSDIKHPRESPFPVPLINRNTVNIKTESGDEHKSACVPFDVRQKSAVKFESNTAYYFSEKVKTPIYIYENAFHLGNLHIQVQEEFGVDASWILQESTLENAPPSFIDYNSNQWTPIQRIDREDRVIKDISAPSIQDLETIQPSPNVFEMANYALETKFTWKVHPPYKPKAAVKSHLYRDYETLERDISENIRMISEEIIDYKRTKESSLRHFQGASQSVDNLFDRVNRAKERITAFNNMPYNALKDLIEKDWTSICIDWNQAKEDVTKLEFQKSKSDAIAVIDDEINKANERIEFAENALKATDIVEADAKRYQVEIEDLKKKIDHKKRERDRANAKVQSSSELDHLRKKTTNNKDFKRLVMPRYQLPEVGVLYELNEAYYLEIGDYDHLKMAEDISARYCDRQCLIVAEA